MKSQKTNLLIISMILNLVLLLGTGYLANQLRNSKAVDSSASEELDAGPGGAENANVATSSDPMKKIPQIWYLMEADDYPTFIANLRKIGCPDETIQLLVAGEINEKYSQQLQALAFENSSESSFWKTSASPGIGASAGMRRRIMDLDQARLNELKDALGDLGVPASSASLFRGGPASSAQMSQYFDFLPGETREAVMSEYMNFQMKSSEIYLNANGVMLPSDQEALRDLQIQMDESLTALMSPEEKQELDLYLSDTANMMRTQLVGFDPTEEEFRALFEIRSSDADQPQSEVDQQIQEVLGEERYADYKKSQDYSYRSLAQLTNRLGLDPGAADEIYGMQNDIQSAQNQILNDPQLNSEQRAAALQEVIRATQESVQAMLGEEGFNYYKNSGGYWINQLEVTAASLEPRELPPLPVLLEELRQAIDPVESVNE
jgi:hypothetical protein